MTAQTHTSEGVHGRLNLRFDHIPASERTSLTVQEQCPPLKVVRAFSQPDGSALTHLHNLSGGVLGGDHLETRIEVGQEARALVTTTGATRLYRCLENAPRALQQTRIWVEANALLEYLPDPLIPFAGARYRQETQIHIAEGAGLFWWETVAPGREARNELFAYDCLELNTDIRVQGKPIACERARLEPHLRPLSSPLRLGPYRYFATFYVCKTGVPAADWLHLEAGCDALAQTLTIAGEVLWGASALTAHGLVIRALSRSGRRIAPGLLEFWKLTKRELYGQEAVPPRKIY